MKAIIFDIQRNSYVDGPGIRTTVFFKGCNLRCKWCHNPESQNFEKEIMFYKNKCTDCGRCIGMTVDDTDFICYNDAKKICGKEYTVDEVFDELIKDKTFYENSGGGVTFSGGECMLQIEFLCQILKKCKESGIHTAVDTAGNVSWEHFERILPFTDLFLYDVKCINEQKHIKSTGASNKQILSNLKKLSDMDSNIIIRIPIICGFNDNREEIEKIADFLKSIKHSFVECLPYHKLGEHKYKALNIKSERFETPTEEKIKEIRNIFNK